MLISKVDYRCSGVNVEGKLGEEVVVPAGRLGAVELRRTCRSSGLSQTSSITKVMSLPLL